MTAYVARLAGPASKVDPAATARAFLVIESREDESRFRYLDTATSRAALDSYVQQMVRLRLAIVGLGGTGSYILDLVAKTSVAEIHLFDGDRFLQHNPFRSPGATRSIELKGGPNKAEHWARVYGRMRRGIHAHPYRIEDVNAGELRAFDFVFVAVDDGPSRALIMDALTAHGVPCIDVGMGVHDVGGQLAATTRVSTGTAKHVMDRSRVPTQPVRSDDAYGHNIQVAELNALNATLAVIKWKKLIGIYADLECEYFSTYSTTVNAIVNEDRA